jgi:hypothetical protein
MTLGYDVLKGVFFLQLFPQILFPANVPKGFNSPDHLSCLILQQRSGNSHGQTLALGADDMNGAIDHFPASFLGIAEDALPIADIRLKDFPVKLTDGLLSGNPGYLFRGAVEKGDPPVMINGKDAISDGIKNCVHTDMHLQWLCKAPISTDL